MFSAPTFATDDQLPKASRNSTNSNPTQVRKDPKVVKRIAAYQKIIESYGYA